jgi:light-regulated signal transduction histidine kinase (bacteriophytochrome)/CheY-like chemotaxis protein
MPGAAIDLEQALTACANEPIHIPGAVQDAGVLLGTGLEVRTVTHVSAGAGALLGEPAESLLGRPVEQLLPSPLLHALRGAAGLSVLREQREYLGRFALGTQHVHVSAHVSGATFVVELELDLGEASAPSIDGASAEAASRNLLTRHRRRPGLVPLLDAGVRGIYELLGYDRVMAYRFLEDGDGEVVAENVQPGLTPYLGLRYPAADIPPQARALYLRSPLRMIADVARPTQALVCADGSASPLDLSLAQLRAVSPVHLVYLSNMGVAASLSLAIVVEGALWGLIACHHRSPRAPSPKDRAAAELFGQMLSLLVSRELEREQRAGRARADDALGVLIAQTEGRSWTDAATVGELLLSVVPADGVVYTSLDGQHVHHGLTPAGEVAREVRDRALASREEMLGTSELGAWLGGRDRVLNGCGSVLAIKPAPLQHPMEIQYYRREVLEEIRWGGNPDKDVASTPEGPRLHPRASFAEYRRLRRGHARPWTADDLSRARALSQIVLRILARDARESRERAELLESHKQRQDLLVSELNHRVKNVLALIRSIARQTAQSAEDLPSYAADFEHRLEALSLAHDLAARAHMHSVDLRSLIATELSPYRSPDSSDVQLEGPVVTLKAEVAPTLALVVHELASNAAKYGALSRAGGQVRVVWWLTDTGLELRFVEHGGPAVPPPTRTGFGTTLIARSIAYELDGHSTLRLPPTGAEFEAFIPLHHLSDHDAAPRARSAPPPSMMPASGARVLIVEDNLLLACDLEQALCAAGMRASAVPSSAAAMAALDATPYDAAVLDVNLRGELSFGVATALSLRRVPFMFLTGYGDELALPPAFAAVPRRAKPLGEGELVSLVRALVEAPQSPSGS